MSSRRKRRVSSGIAALATISTGSIFAATPAVGQEPSPVRPVEEPTSGVVATKEGEHFDISGQPIKADSGVFLPPDDPDGVTVPADEVTQRSVSSCNAGWNCMWTSANYSGSMGQLQGSNSDWSVFPNQGCQHLGTNGPNWKDCASSVANRKGPGISFQVQRNVNYGGGGLNVLSGTSVPNLGANLIDDDIASNRF